MNPTDTLKKRYTNAVVKLFSRTREKISSSKVENVVNAPKNPIMRAIRKFSFIKNLSESRTNKKPIRKEPVMLIKNVGKGNFSKMFASGEMFIKYRATDPKAPPIATNKILVNVSVCKIYKI